MISVDEALSLVLALAGPPDAEDVALEHAAGRALLRPARARLTQPPFDSAAMDGYALRRAEQHLPLQVIGEAAAGHPWQGATDRAQTAIRIFTGAPVPPGYDCVAMQENIRRSGDQIEIVEHSPNNNIRRRGSDFAEGDQIEAGRLLSPIDIGLLAAMNVPTVTVARAPKVAVLAGGDELLRPGTEPAEGQIISSNDLAIAALARATGAEPHILPIARDNEQSLRESFDMARDADLIVTIGGASVGDHDLIGKVAAELGMERSFHRIAMRPGKPLMAGRIGRSAMIGLPGNPVSAIVCGILFMQPLIRRMLGLPAQSVSRTARLATDLRPEGDRQHYLRARLSSQPDLPGIAPYDDQDSAKLLLLSQADALLIRPAHDPARRAGEVVSYLPLSR